MLRSVGAVLAGFVAATIVVVLSTALAVALMLPPAGPGMMPEPTGPYLAVNLFCGLLAAIFGGWLAARLARRAPLGHAMAVGTIMLVLGLAAAAMESDGSSGSQPGWYLYALPLLGWIGASLGGVVEARSEKGEARSKR
ncbi:MAG: hypothetical protein ABR551_01860 [Gemmatimonadales bacterium]